MGCLYQLTSPSGKSYIGITTKTVEKRFAKHVEHAIGKRENGVVYSALRKYGPEAFLKKVLVIADDWSYLCDLERKAIVAFGTRHPLGYNMTDGGEGVIGPRSDADRAKMSAAQVKRFASHNERKRLVESGKKGIATHRERQKALHIDGRPPWLHRKHVAAVRNGSVEHRAKISAATKVAMARTEVSEKVSKCAAARAANPEWRAKISALKKGKKSKPATEQRKMLIAEARRREWADPVIRAKRLLALEKARSAKKVKKQ